MNIQQLRYFCSVMRAGTFSSAAREEGVSVQAVSKALAALEDELGQQLFLRRSKGAVPTAFGTQLFEYAHAAIEAFDQVGSFARDCRAAQPASEALSILLAVPSFNNHDAVCRGLERFLSRQLGIEVSFDICSGDAAIPRLLAHELDVLVTVGEYENPCCDSLMVGTLPTGVFVPRNHPLAGRSEVTKADLAPYPVCFAAGLDDFNETILNRYLAAGLASKPVRVSTGRSSMPSSRRRMATPSRWACPASRLSRTA